MVGTNYWIDLRDLLLYGDQFVNYDPATAQPFLPLPAATAQRRYAAAADIAKFFSDEANGNIEGDGIVTLSVLGRQRNQTSGLTLGKA